MRAADVCGYSQPAWFGSFQIDQRETLGKCFAAAATKRPYSRGSGLQICRNTLQRDAHEGAGPVNVSCTAMPRAWAPWTNWSQRNQSYFTFRGFRVEFGDETTQFHNTFDRTTSTPSDFISLSVCWLRWYVEKTSDESSWNIDSWRELAYGGRRREQRHRQDQEDPAQPCISPPIAHSLFGESTKRIHTCSR